MDLLKKLCSIHAPSGEEYSLKEYLLEYIQGESGNWKAKPTIITDGIQDCLILVFGKPKTAVYAHMDSIGFTVGYDNELIKIGGPDTSGNWQLRGTDSKGEVEGILLKSGDKLSLQCKRKVDRGTSLTFSPDFQESKHFIQSPYLDNRLGVWNALKLAETLTDGAIAFSCWEEHGGGSIGYLADLLYREYGIQQALVSDITWVTDGVKAGEGCAVSLRDSGIPRKRYINRILEVLKDADIPIQLEVESAGGSDGTALQRSPFPIDWCFIGAAESHVHSPLEKVHKEDIKAMLAVYRKLMHAL